MSKVDTDLLNIVLRGLSEGNVPIGSMSKDDNLDAAVDIVDAQRKGEQHSQRMQIFAERDAATLARYVIQLGDNVENLQNLLRETLERLGEMETHDCRKAREIKKLKKRIKKVEKRTCSNKAKILRQQKKSKEQEQELSENRLAIQHVGWHLGVCNIDDSPKKMKRNMARIGSYFGKGNRGRQFPAIDGVIDGSYREVQ